MKKRTIPSISHAATENLVALSASFHTHPKYDEFYKREANFIGGFIGIYELVIDMAAVMTDWEENRGGKDLYDNTEIIWDELVDKFIGRFIDTAVASTTHELPDIADLFYQLVPPPGSPEPKKLQRPCSRRQKIEGNHV